MPKKIDPKNIVIMRTDRIGEVLLSVVAIDALKKRCPDSSISFVTSEYSKPLLEERSDIKEIITMDTLTRRGWLAKSRHLADLLRKRKFDTAVVLNPHKLLHLACFLAGIPIRVGYNRKWGFLLTKKIEDSRDSGKKHEIEYTMDLLSLLDAKDSSPRPALYVNEEAKNSVDELLREKNIRKDRPIVAIHPGSSNPAKIWSYERYGELVNKIDAEFDPNIVIIGDRGEKHISDKIIGQVKEKVIDLTGRLSLKELIAFLSKIDLFIGNDTGPMHMAAALNIPVIAIFGRNIAGVSPVRWGPWGDEHVVFHKHPGCEPCYDAVCPHDYKCLRAVTVSAVFEAVKQKLRARV